MLSVPTVELAKQVAGIGNGSGNKVDKFKMFKLTPMPASQVAPPLIAECYVFMLGGDTIKLPSKMK